jgi:hypothetical protein
MTKGEVFPFIFPKKESNGEKNYIFAADNGEMAEWSNAAVLKTVVPLPRNRGFESLFLRH